MIVLSSDTREEAFPNLDILFQPESIAVLGASNDLTKIGGRPLGFLQRFGYAGAVYPVNPKYSEILGARCYVSVADIPGPVDVALVALPAALVPEALRDCARKGVKAAVIFSAGFAEVGPAGEELQRELVRIARAGGMRLVGPNCVGYISEPQRVVASFATSLERPGGLTRGQVALVSQSGALGAFIYSIAQEQGLGFSPFITVGNEADLDIADFVGYLATSPATKAIGCYVEGIKHDGRRLMRAANMARRQGKPVAVLKTGRSEVGRRAAESHTGSIAGVDAVYDGMFRQTGMVRVDDVQEMLDFLSLCTKIARPRGKRLGIMSISGGLGVWVSDKCAEMGVEVPVLSQATSAALKAALPSFSSSRNPVDFTAQVLNEPAVLRKCVTLMLQEAGVDVLLIIMGLQERNGGELARDIVAALNGSEKPAVVTWMAGPREAYEVLRQGGVPAYDDIARCVKALGRVMCLAHDDAQVETQASEEPECPVAPADREAVRQALEVGQGRVPEHIAKGLLRNMGFHVPPGRLVSSLSQALEAADALGYPVVLKLQAAKAIHKTELNLVRLNLATREQVAEAYQQLTAAISADVTGAADGVLVEKLVQGGREVIVGCTTDPVFGPVVMFGVGGVLVEALRDVSFRVAPVSVAEALRMTREIKGTVLLDAFRGAPPCDRLAIARTVSRLSRVAWDLRDLVHEVEINPLIVLPEGQGAAVADALLVGAG